MDLQFNDLPKAVTQLYDKLENIERLLLQQYNPKNEVDLLLTIKQTAEFLSLSVPTIYGLVSRSQIPSCKKGKRLYFSKQELTEWIKTGRKKTIAEISSEAHTYLTKKK